MRVALVHEWLVNIAGSERVLLALGRIFPDADIFVSVLDKKLIPVELSGRRVYTTFIQKLPFAVKKYQTYLPIMPFAYEQLDLSNYDLVISSSHACAKGVITRPDAIHICYCHTPMRYAWTMKDEYLREVDSRLKRFLVASIMNYLRIWDYCSAARVDWFLANSNAVAGRIQKYYRRDATVIPPPVNLEGLSMGNESENFYLIVSRLVPYKRIDIAVEAFSKISRRLVIIGDGPGMSWLKRTATSNVEFLGYQPDDVIKDYYARCRAFIFPGEEDFGITPVEAQAAGKPVIGYGKAGLLDTVIPDKTGVLFTEQSVEALTQAIRRFESMYFDPHEIRRHAEYFSEERFKERIFDFIGKKICLTGES